MKETNISQLCRIEASKLGATIFRNNVGGLYDKTGRWVNFGLCKGSSDLIGWTKDGKFLAIEVKKPGKKPTKSQINFLDKVIQDGGVGGTATCVEDIAEILNK